MDEAISIAQAIAAAKYSSRGNIPEIDGVVAICEATSRSASDTLIYAVNLSENQGFVLVSATRTGLSLIGYSDAGAYNENDKVADSGFNLYMEAAKDYVADQKASGGLIPTPTPNPDPTFPTVHINIVAGPHLTVEWGQSYPEGIFCPNKIAGCTQTAMAQMMSFIEQPTSITLTYPNRDKNTQVLAWTELKKHKKSGYLICYCNVSEEIHKSLGRLCRELGHRNAASYETNGTGSYISNARATFATLCPNNSVSSVLNFYYPYESLLTNLKDNKSIAYIKGDDGTVGHAWVCDGVEKIGTASYEYLADKGLTWIEKAPLYYHFNWGDCGYNNGWFSPGVFEPTNRSRNDFKYNTQYFIVTK